MLHDVSSDSADDTIIYLTIANEDDASTLQEDFNKLGQWENEWCMKFHPDKCNVLRVKFVGLTDFLQVF
jgi:hypothetical protein